MNDLLTPEEIVKVTNVKPRAINRVIRQVEVLKRAGIYHWLDDTGEIQTTWTHVHNAGQNVQSDIDIQGPRFDAIR